MSASKRAAPLLWTPYVSAWSALALELGHRLPTAIGDAAAGRLVVALSAGEAPVARDAQLLLFGQVAPRLMQLGAVRLRHTWTHALRADLDAFALAERRGKAALWHQERNLQANPPDAFAALPWLAGELVDAACSLAGLLGASAVQLAFLAGRGEHDALRALALAMATTLLVGAVLQSLLARPQQRNEAQGSAAHRSYGNVRHAFFDNVVLGNAGNGQRWRAAYDDASAALVRSQHASAMLSGATALLAQLAGAGVLSWPIVRALHRDSGQPLPADWLQLLPVARRAAAALSASGRLQAELQGLRRHTRLYRTNVNKLRQEATLVPADLVTQAVRMVPELSSDKGVKGLWTDVDCSPRRVRLEGPNGSGKAMALLALKQRLGRRAVLLPAHHDLMFDDGLGSSGQRAKANLLQLQSDLRAAPEVDHVLLDRWDGNLDHANVAELDAYLDVLAATHRVVEVRRAKGDEAALRKPFEPSPAQERCP